LQKFRHLVLHSSFRLEWVKKSIVVSILIWEQPNLAENDGSE
jgi:hypothetical protein